MDQPPALAPNDFETVEEFHARVEESLGGAPLPSSGSTPEGTRAVMEHLENRCDPGQLDHVLDQMPEDIADGLFPERVEA